MLERLKERRDKRGEGGFTLIELLIVIIILAILAAIVVFAVGTTGKNAAVAACNSTVKTVQTALEAYKAQSTTNTYPTAIATLTKHTGVGATEKGPWLRSAPPTTPAGHKFWISAYTKTTGTFTVTTAAGSKTSTTANVCATA